MTQAKRQYDDVSNDVGSIAGRTSNGSSTDKSGTDVQRKSDENPTDVRRKLDGRPTKVGRKSNGRPTKIGRKSNKRPTKVGRVELSRRCDNGGRRRFLATLQRWPGALLRRWSATYCSLQHSCGAAAATRWTSQRCCDGQQRAGRRNVATMASKALDLAALLRWPVARWTSRCVAAMSGNALGLETLLRCPTTLQLWPTLRCSVFVFFTRQLEERKRMEKERSFDTCFLVSRLRLSLLWLIVRNAKLLVGCKKRKAPSNNTSSNSSNALLPATTTRVATTQEFQKHKKSVAFNMKQQGIKFF